MRAWRHLGGVETGSLAHCGAGRVNRCGQAAVTGCQGLVGEEEVGEMTGRTDIQKTRCAAGAGSPVGLRKSLDALWMVP